MIFDFRLKVFYSVSQHLNFTKAGQELFISQPAVTKHIKELESQLGVPLFRRNGSNVSLTPSGEILLQHAREVFKIYASLENSLAQVQNPTSGTLRIGASSTLAQYVLPKILALFKKAHPAVHITFISGNTRFIEKQIIEEELDIALIEGIAHHPQLAYQPFVKDELVLAARSKSKWAAKQEIKLSQLIQLPLVLRESGSGTLEVILKSLGKEGISLKDLSIDMQLSSTESIKQYVMHTESAAFLSIHAISKELKEKDLSVIEIKGLEIMRTFQFIHLHGLNSHLTEVFKRFCLSHYLL